MLNPQPLPPKQFHKPWNPGSDVMLNPQPLPPKGSFLFPVGPLKRQTGVIEPSYSPFR